MNNAIQIFDNAEFGHVRVIEFEDTNKGIWFIGVDVARALDYSDAFGALKKHVDTEDKLVCQIDSAGQKRDATAINESGVYSLILRSNLPKAKEFKRWITSEVIPSIRKQGMYLNPQNTISPEFLRQVADALEQATTQVKVLTNQLVEAQPLVDYCNVILSCKELVTTSLIAKDYGFSAKAFNNLLRDLGVQFKQSGVWLLYQKYAEEGWAQTKTHKYMGADEEIHCKAHTYWTQKGRLGLYHLLKAEGYLPLIEC